jgi:uncharacterized damage-inducible protein DinB
MAETNSDAERRFVEFSRRTLVGEYWPRLRSAVESLNEQQLWSRANHASNSVGNLLLHLDGDVRQWLVWPFKRIDGIRDRSAEFAARGIAPGPQLLNQLGATLQEASDVLQMLTNAELAATYSIDGHTVTGLDAVYHVVEHFGVHYGQVLYITKMLRAVNLRFYRERDATLAAAPRATA